MAIRYSGDTEVRVRWSPRDRCYIGSVRDPNHRWRGRCRKPFYQRDATSSDAYDAAAKDLLHQAQRWADGKLMVERRWGRVRVRRVFQAPCPVKMIP